MKNYLQIFTVFFLLLCFFEMKAQNFYAQNSGTTANLMDVYFATDSIGWVVGEGGTILKTTNGGDTWVPQTSNTTATLHALTFSDANNGWVVGANGTILKTANGGSTWQKLNSPIFADLLGVTLSNNVVLACGACGLLLRSTDGGNSWTPTFKGTDFFYDIKASGSTVYAGGTRSTYVKSFDSGKTWSQVLTVPEGWPVYYSNGDIKDIDVIGTNFYAINNYRRGVVFQLNDTTKYIPQSGFVNDLFSISAPTDSTIFIFSIRNQFLQISGSLEYYHNPQIGKWKYPTIYGSYFRKANLGWAVGESGTIFRFCFEKKFNLEMVWVEGGTFTMGCTEEQPSDCWYWEKPIQRISVSSFLISKYEITQGQWSAVIGTDKTEAYTGVLGENYPINSISWINALLFCNKLSVLHGFTPYYYIDSSLKQDLRFNYPIDYVYINANANGYRLPTEVEWEYAARGGNLSKGFRYSGSDSLNIVAWNPNNSKLIISEVGQKLPNELGLYDMSGNVYELCWDEFEYDLSSKPKCSLLLPQKYNTKHTTRGGSYRYNKHLSFRWYDEYWRYGQDDVGFRIIRPIK